MAASIRLVSPASRCLSGILRHSLGAIPQLNKSESVPKIPQYWFDTRHRIVFAEVFCQMSGYISAMFVHPRKPARHLVLSANASLFISAVAVEPTSRDPVEPISADCSEGTAKTLSQLSQYLIPVYASAILPSGVYVQNSILLKATVPFSAQNAILKTLYGRTRKIARCRFERKISYSQPSGVHDVCLIALPKRCRSSSIVGGRRSHES